MESKERLAGDKPTSKDTDADPRTTDTATQEITMKVRNSKLPNRVFKGIAKVTPIRLCNCPGSEPGKVKIDIDQHLTSCRFRKRSSQYATKTSVIPSKIVDGCSLGIMLGEEYY